MTIKLAVSTTASETIRSSIYAFLSGREENASREGCVFITVVPSGDASLYSIEFDDQSDANAFLDYLAGLRSMSWGSATLELPPQ